MLVLASIYPYSYIYIAFIIDIFKNNLSFLFIL